MESKFIIQGEGICRNMYHIDIHDPKTPKVFCNFCESYIKENPVNKKFCQCCGNKIIKKKEYKLLRIMLNNATTQYESMVKAFIETPVQGTIIVYQKWKWITYEIPLDCVALYYDTREPLSIKERKGLIPNWAKKHFKPESIQKIKDKGILAFVDSHTKSAYIG